MPLTSEVCDAQIRESTATWLERVRPQSDAGLTLVLTGAGVSAESGIPTFRGAEGYWTVGSRHFRPMELATRMAFGQMPRVVWSWYLYRHAVCRRARPNAAHKAVASAQQTLGDSLLLVTQNVDSLHRRAGSPAQLTYEIHGNIGRMRCLDECSTDTFGLPEAFDTWQRDQQLSSEQFALLHCPGCGGPARPHVLWFDECYDEAHFKFDSTLDAARSAGLLVVAGTTGGTNLPLQIAKLCAARGVPRVVIDPHANPFEDLRSDELWLRETATRATPTLMRQLSPQPQHGV